MSSVEARNRRGAVVPCRYLGLMRHDVGALDDQVGGRVRSAAPDAGTDDVERTATQ
jgi:hypothetical protein